MLSHPILLSGAQEDRFCLRLWLQLRPILTRHDIIASASGFMPTATANQIPTYHEDYTDNPCPGLRQRFGVCG